MSFDEISDLTAGVYFVFFYILLEQHKEKFHAGECRKKEYYNKSI